MISSGMAPYCRTACPFIGASLAGLLQNRCEFGGMNVPNVSCKDQEGVRRRAVVSEMAPGYGRKGRERLSGTAMVPLRRLDPVVLLFLTRVGLPVSGLISS